MSPSMLNDVPSSWYLILSALLFAAVALAAGTAGSRALDTAREQTIRREAGRAAEAAGMRRI